MRDFFEGLNKLAKKCNFDADPKPTKTKIRDILVLGTTHSKAREACFQEDHKKMTTERALQIIEMFEDNAKTVKNIQDQREPTESFYVIRSQT